MPIFVIGLIIGAGGTAYFSESAKDLVKWGVIGAGGYVAAKHFKVI